MLSRLFKYRWASLASKEGPTTKKIWFSPRSRWIVTGGSEKAMHKRISYILGRNRDRALISRTRDQVLFPSQLATAWHWKSCCGNVCQSVCLPVKTYLEYILRLSVEWNASSNSRLVYFILALGSKMRRQTIAAKVFHFSQNGYIDLDNSHEAIVKQKVRSNLRIRVKKKNIENIVVSVSI